MLSRVELAAKFVKAGNAEVDMDTADLAVVGIYKLPKSFKSVSGRTLWITTWESYCQFVYETITGKAMPRCPMNGRGFRSRWFSRVVSKAILAAANTGN